VSPVLLVVLAPFAVGLVVWAIVDLERYLMFAVLTSIVFPASLGKPGGANIAAVDVLLLLALMSWLINNAVGNAPDPMVRGSKIILGGAVFATIQAASLIWTTNPHKTIQFSIQAFELFVIFPVVFASLPRSVRIVEKGLIWFLGATAVLAVALLFVFATNPTARQAGTYVPGLGKNPAGSYEAFGLVIGYALFLLRRRLRWLLLLVLLLDAGGLAVSASRGALLGAAAGILVVSLIMRRGAAAAVMVLLILIAAYFVVIAPGEAAKTAHPGAYSSATVRLQLWSAALHTIRLHPFLGVGAGAYYDVLHGQSDPNNTLLRTWAETGILGLLALMYLLFAYSQMVARWRRHPDRSAAALAAACAGVFIVQLMHSEVDVSWVRGLGSIMFASLGLTIALERVTEHETAPAIDPATTESVPAGPAAGDEAYAPELGCRSSS
jgi:O-antigen ligase